MISKTNAPVTQALMLVICSILAKPVNAAGSTFSDGEPWIMSGSDGHRGKVIFSSDGTGKISSGYMKMNLTWFQKADATCIKIGFMAAQCFVLVAVPGVSMELKVEAKEG